MAEIFNLREEYVKSIEKKAYEKLRTFPSDVLGVYLTPTNLVSSLKINESFKKSMLLRNVEIVEAIRNFPVEFQDGIIVCAEECDDDGNMMMRLTNRDSSTCKTITITVNSEMDHEDREMLVNMIAYYLKDKEVTVMFLSTNTFESIEKMVKDDEEYYVPGLLE